MLNKKIIKEYHNICKQKTRYEKQIDKQAQRVVETIFEFFDFKEKNFIVYCDDLFNKDIYYLISNKPGVDFPNTVCYEDKLVLNGHDYSECFPRKFSL